MIITFAMSFSGCSSEPRLKGLPNGFPGDVYLYEGASLHKVMMDKGKMLNSDGSSVPAFPMPMMKAPKDTYMIELHVKANPDLVYDRCKEGMRSEGWELVSQGEPKNESEKMVMGMMRAMRVLPFKKGDKRVSQFIITKIDENNTRIVIQSIGK